MANPATGGNTRIVMDFETAFKTAPALATGVIIPHSTCDVKVDQAPQQSSGLRSGRHSSLPFYGNKVINGTLTGPVGEESIGFILKTFFGAPDSTAVHLFEIEETTPSFIVSKEFSDLDLYYVYSGCKANSLSFTFNNNNELLYNLGFLAAEETKGTSPYDSSPESMYDELTYQNVDLSTVEEAGAETDIFEEITLNVTQNPTMAYGLSGGGVATYADHGKVEVSGSLRGVFTNDNLLVKGRGHTESRLNLVLRKSSGYYLRFYIPELQFSQESPAITGPGMAMLNLTFVGYYQDSVDADDVVIILNNGRTDYT